ncbi:DUF4132 domain-containing protein [Pseudoalteromonas sp. MM17-2]|uniref:DUF4132 domain-containing protein n=1 Tax=Pseudoalteromonas sp. MM17-2 TaxID=2917753 RepID=UPI001EF510F5|nr:DUF4132 domain-containing protein [Pseudoalteromonas sp. MM17-2]MCG7545526.1 DUF4132 domain-containing protein [Pseudoalteromonas sp. MM17-2]
MKLIDNKNKKEIIKLLDDHPDEEIINKFSDLNIDLREDIRLFEEETLLQTLLKRGRPNLVMCLIDSNCFISYQHELLNTVLGSWGNWVENNELKLKDLLEKLFESGLLEQLQLPENAESFIFGGFSKLVESSQFDTVQWLQELGLNFDELSAISGHDIAKQLVECAHQEDDEAVASLFKKGLISLEKWKNRGLATDSILVSAMSSGLFKTLQFLLTEIPLIINSHYIACLSVRYDIPDDLLPTFLPKEILKNNKYKSLSLLYSIEEGDGNEKLLTYLVENDPSLIKNNDDLPLPRALHRNYALFKKIIELGADINYVNKFGYSLLDYIQLNDDFDDEHIEKARFHGAKTAFELSIDAPLCPKMYDILKLIDGGESWSDGFIAKLSILNDRETSRWHALIAHCVKNKSATPSKLWLKQAKEMIDDIGADEFSSMISSLLPLIEKPRNNNLALAVNSKFAEYMGFDSVMTSRSDELIYAFSQSNVLALKGLLWSSIFSSDISISSQLRKVAQSMYKKVHDVGMRNAKLANAAMTALTLLPNEQGISDILIIYSTTKYNPALKNVQRIVNNIAQNKGTTAEALAQSYISDFGLYDIGKYQKQLGDSIAAISCTHVGKCELTWQTSEKTQKSVPTNLKTKFKEEIKALKGLVKEIQNATTAHTQRIESFYISSQSISFSDWQARYIDDKLIGFIARRLIWRLTGSDGQSCDVLFVDSQYIDCYGKKVELDSQSVIRLWHPSEANKDEIIAWQTLLAHHKITQPFKQAHREIYILTEAEKRSRTHSARFENHVLNQQKFHAVATQRRWHQTRGGGWDGGSETEATKYIDRLHLTVIFDTQGLRQYGDTDTGIHSCVGTGKVFFRHQDSDELIALEDVDKTIFSEVMRDIDLFVSVANISNDPERENGEASYWFQQGFGELSQIAKTRKQVLANIIATLPNNKVFTLEGNFLYVQGKLAKYKVHLGSSNILIQPHNQYLCILPKITKTKAHLPFEEDKKLLVILSKALLLASDNKIKDEAILSQINGSSLVRN